MNLIWLAANVVTEITVWSAFVIWYWPLTGPMFFVRWGIRRFGEEKFRRWALRNAAFKELALRAVLELRPFALVANPISILDYAVHTDDAMLYRVWIILCYLFFELWLWRIGKDDDRWKKRRKRAAAKVQELGGKLVVVPVPSAA